MADSTPVLGKLTPMIPAGSNMAASVEFYERTLGFVPTYRADDLSMVIFQRDGTEIMLQNYDDAHVASQTALRVEVAGVDALYSEYQAQNIPPFNLGGPAGGLGTLKGTPWGTREFAVRDLAGVCITFYERNR